KEITHPITVSTQEKAVARLNVLRKQLGKPPLILDEDETVPIEALWTEIEELEAEVDRKSKLPQRPSKRAAQAPIEPQARHAEPTTGSAERGMPQLQLRRHYAAAINEDQKAFV